ncbi:uncharacterized protein LOC115372975 isoform X2 [Myripristis murdjan]|uniref:Uncharacterized LOC115372975 n=1 Tax=Myripristis murdjan TaxID=586833 RepID=A0A667XHE9_9TELE|nr:uncharacterized protein LOC115372975 isoform X2 [Myripristis murdjan]
MKDGAAAEKQTMVSRQDIFEEYVSYYRQAGSTELPQGSDAQIVMEGGEALGRDWTKHLAAFMKASEFLERLCVNLFLQPWKKEFKTLKTFTGPFVYHLLPVLTTSTIDSVLASIGYLPHTDTQLRYVSQYRLREDANPNTAMLVGFELLLARVECRSLLEFLEQNQPGLQEWSEFLQRRAGQHKMEPVEKMTVGHEEEEEMKKKEEERKKDGEFSISLVHQEKEEDLEVNKQDKSSQLPLSLEATPAVKPQPKPLQNHYSEDKSIIEMHRNYPDLAIRGRPLIQDKTQRASNSRDSTKALQITSKNNDANSSKAGTLVYSDYNKSAAIGSKSDCSKPCDIVDSDSRSSSSSSNNSNSGVCSDNKGFNNISTKGGSIHSSSDGGRAEDGVSGPQAISMHITLRAGTRPDPSPRQPHPTAEPPPWTDYQTAAGLQNTTPPRAEAPSLTSMEEEQELNKLAERMGQLSVLGTGEDRGKQEEEKRDEEMRKQEKEANEGDEEEVQVLHKLRNTVEENPPQVLLGHGTSQLDGGILKQQKQPTLCHPSLQTICNVSDCQTCKGGAGIVGWEGEKRHERDGERGGGEDEHLAQSYIIVEHKKK